MDGKVVGREGGSTRELLDRGWLDERVARRKGGWTGR